MKKSLIALAVAGALTAPMVAQADATLYGSMRLHAGSGTNSDLNVENDASRMGIKGSADTSIDGVKAIYQLEAFIGRDNGTDTTLNQNEATFGVDGRLAYVGLTGGFGTVAVGQQWTPLYSMVTGATDMTINETGETSQYLRVDSAVAYVSPNMGGFTVAAVVVGDGRSAAEVAANDTSDADHYQLVAKYAVGGFTVAAGMHEASLDAGTDVKALSASYTMDALTVAALYQDVEVGTAKSRNPYELAASYTMGATKLIGTYYDQDATVDTNGYNLEVQHKLGNQATVYANYNSDEVGTVDTNAYGVGLRVDF